jgi:hypothetical protein
MNGCSLRFESNLVRAGFVRATESRPHRAKGHGLPKETGINPRHTIALLLIVFGAFLVLVGCVVGGVGFGDAGSE